MKTQKRVLALMPGERKTNKSRTKPTALFSATEASYSHLVKLTVCLGCLPNFTTLTSICHIFISYPLSVNPVLLSTWHQRLSACLKPCEIVSHIPHCVSPPQSPLHLHRMDFWLLCSFKTMKHHRSLASQQSDTNSNSS